MDESGKPRALAGREEKALAVPFAAGTETPVGPAGSGCRSACPGSHGSPGTSPSSSFRVSFPRCRGSSDAGGEGQSGSDIPPGKVGLGSSTHGCQAGRVGPLSPPKQAQASRAATRRFPCFASVLSSFYRGTENP